MHLMWNSFKYAARQEWGAIARSLKRSDQAATVAEADGRFPEFQEAWDAKSPAIIGLLDNAWAEFVHLLGFGR